MTIAAKHLDAAQAVALLQQAWDDPTAHETRRYRYPVEITPIARSHEDQQPPPGVQNPMWDIVRWLPATRTRRRLDPELTTYGTFTQPVANELETAGVGRHGMCTRYAWSIPTPGDVAWMVELLDGRPVVEIGAGSGYWAWQLEQAGVDVAAYDPHPPGPDNHFCKHDTYTTVLPGDATAVAQNPGRVLLMVWPPYGGDHAAQAVTDYAGDTLIYAGEPEYGCTADDRFHELLGRDWTEAGDSPLHVTWSGIHCWLTAYTRR